MARVVAPPNNRSIVTAPARSSRARRLTCSRPSPPRNTSVMPVSRWNPSAKGLARSGRPITTTLPSWRAAASSAAHFAPPPSCQSAAAAGSDATISNRARSAHRISLAAERIGDGLVHLGPHILVPILAILIDIGDARLGDGVGRHARHPHVEAPARRLPDGREDLL